MIKVEMLIEKLTKEGTGEIKVTLHGEEEELLRFTEKLIPLLSQYRVLPEKTEKQDKQKSDHIKPSTAQSDHTEEKITKRKPGFIVCLDNKRVLVRMLLGDRSLARVVSDRPEVKDEVKNYIYARKETINTPDEFEKIVTFLRKKYGYGYKHMGGVRCQ